MWLISAHDSHIFRTLLLLHTVKERRITTKLAKQSYVGLNHASNEEEARLHSIPRFATTASIKRRASLVRRVSVEVHSVVHLYMNAS